MRTSRIILGTGVTCPILRYHPAVIAQATATLSSMAPGRAYLAVGTGVALNEYAATGNWPEYAERQDRLREAIELIRHLWSGEEVTYSGLSTKPARHGCSHPLPRQSRSTSPPWLPAARHSPAPTAMA